MRMKLLKLLQQLLTLFVILLLVESPCGELGVQFLELFFDAWLRTEYLE